MNRLWKWFYTLSRKKIKEEHLNKYHCDIRCPNCNEWFSISGVKYQHKILDKPDFGFHALCGQCGYDSYWNAVSAPVLLRCDEKGNPL